MPAERNVGEFVVGGGEDAAATRCRNCGAVAGPRYCGACGQEIDDHRASVVALAGELVSEWFSLDGKLVRSLAALARPGKLTRLHLEGKRAPYLSPLRLYAVASLALFSSALALRTPVAEKVDLYVFGELVTEAPAVAGRSDFVILEKGSDFSRWLVRSWPGGVERLRAMPPQKLLDEVFSGLRRNLPAALVLFLPLLALALKLLYLRTGTLYVDHLVFAAHTQSAFFGAIGLAWLATRVAGLNEFFQLGACMLAGLLMLAVYLPLALRRVHRQRWWLTIAKSVLLVYLYARLLGWTVGLSILVIVLRL